MVFFLLGLVPARYILAILGSIAMAIVYGLKVNLSVAMVAMLNHTAIKLSSDSYKMSHILTTNLTAATSAASDESCGSDSTSSAAVEVTNSNKLWYILYDMNEWINYYEYNVASKIEFMASHKYSACIWQPIYTWNRGNYSMKIC